LIVLNASLNTGTFGTSRNISSVTLDPPKLLTQRSSRFRRRLSSARERSSGMEGRARRAKRRSMSMPRKVHLTMGTKASGTPCWKSISQREQKIQKEKRGAYSNFSNSLRVPQHLLEQSVELLSLNMLRHDQQRIDIRPGTVYTKAV
jgi:hypothetical protein